MSNEPMENLLRARAARSVPLVFVRTSDQIDAARRIAELWEDGPPEGAPQDFTRPVIVHDCCQGLTANKKSQELLGKIMGDVDPLMFTDPTTALGRVLEVSRSSRERFVLVCLGADRWLGEPRPAMAALLLRNVFESRGSTLVGLGSGYLPAAELGADVSTVDDLPPDATVREAMISEFAKSSELDLPEPVKQSLLTYTRGLSGFAVRQTCALSASRSGFNLEIAERTWREQIDSTPGLKVLTDRPSPDMVAGLAGWNTHVERLKNARVKPEAVVFIDEIEKALAGASGAVADSSGASQQVLGRMLSEMENTGAQGSIFLGPPGTGKSLAAQAAGAALGVPTIAFNPSDCKGSLVGETEKNATRALSVLRALAGRAYWIATCNGIASLPPELLRRFTTGVWFFDLPSQEELAAIWAVHLKSRGLDTAERWSQDHGWVGADVRNVVRDAWNAGVPVSEIAKTHVPSSRASAEMIERLRRMAVGTYRSAQYAGAYRLPKDGDSTLVTGRTLSLE